MEEERRVDREEDNEPPTLSHYTHSFLTLLGHDFRVIVGWSWRYEVGGVGIRWGVVRLGGMITNPNLTPHYPLTPHPYFPYHQSVFNRNLDLFLSCSTAFGWWKKEGRERRKEDGKRDETRDEWLMVGLFVLHSSFLLTPPSPPQTPH